MPESESEPEENAMRALPSIQTHLLGLSRAAALPHDKAIVPARAHPACHGLMI